MTVQKEIMRLVSEKDIDLKGLAVDKGADAVLQTIFSLIPLALKALKILT